MQKLVRDYLYELNKKQRKRRKTGIAVMLLVVLVVGGVIGSLTQYGVALTGGERCGLEEHQHTEACYMSELACGLEESEGHTHTDACRYPEELICGLEETESQDGEEGHVHTEDCYVIPEGWACGLEESEGHIHTDSCYTSVLVCGMEEHIHTEDCYIDKNADVEDTSIWDAQYADADWTENWGENLAIAAQMQVGYRESSDNYIVAEDGSHKGYTRYGQFVGDEYRDWNVAFINFCLYYAGLTETKIFPDEKDGARQGSFPEGLTDATKWYEEFLSMNEQEEDYLACLTDTADTTMETSAPVKGDIIFFEQESGGKATETRMGVVSSYNRETGTVKVIEGDSDNEVKENTYDAGSQIIRCLKVTELEKRYKKAPDMEEENQDPEVQPEVQPEEVTEQDPEVQPEEEPSDFTTFSRVGDLDKLEVLEVGAATEDTGEPDDVEDMEEDNTWSFDAYYVNQDDRRDIVKTSDFNLKYQMEFHTSRNFKANEIVIQVERRLFDYRNGEAVIPDQIAVPQVVKDGDTERPVENKNMPFNYRVITDKEGTEYLEFFNYREIPAGTNVAWQVLYQNLKIMQIIDEQDWKLNPKIIIWDTDEKDTPVYGDEKVKRSAEPLKGQTDSSVKLSIVTKKAYHENAKQYTPELYTASQVRAYTENISPENESRFFTKDESGKEILNKAYYYAVWEVTMKGSASQPWEIRIQELPGAGGEVVGYKDNSNKARGYDVSIDSGSALTENIAVARNEKTSWSSRFYVVTAYPAQNVTPGKTKISNEIEITAVPCDGKDKPEVKKSDVECVYKDFTWTYPSDAIGVEKKSDDEDPDGKEKDYTGWLEVYKRSTDDYGDIPFTSLGKFRGYGLTHETTGENLGQYKEGTGYKLITADDFMYVIDGDDYKMLGKDDYYYSGVSITQRDYGYDIWEDAEASQPEINGDTSEQSLIIYAKYGADESDEWKEVATVPWDDSGVMSYTFSAEQIARQPYRVKAEHVSTNYRTTCEIKVKVRMKKDAPTMKDIMTKYEKGDISAISFEDLSGVIAQTKTPDGTWELTEVGKVEAGNNYSEPGLIGATEKLYDELSGADTSDGNNFPMYRDNAYKKVTGLEPHAESNKAVTSITNDVVNRRGQVVYSLTAHDGYEIFSEEAVTELKRQGMESPGRKNVAFYDLLPEGMTFDPSYPVRAGRITNLDSKRNYIKQPGLWDSGQVEVSWETKDNYNGTSRTMVIFHVKYSGEDAAVYSNENWIEGWGVSFRAYYDWEDTKLIQEGTNISAFMPDTTDPHYGDENYPLLGTVDEVAMDDGIIVPSDYEDAYQDFGKNIDGNPANDHILNVLYAKNDESEDIAQSYNSAVTKSVRADADKYSSYRSSAVVEENGFYTYDIRISTGNTSLQNIIVYDHLENAKTDREDDNTDPNTGFENANWTGTFQSVMTSGLEKLGVQPVVYYSADRNALMPMTRDDLQALEDGKLENLKDTNGKQVWYTEEEFKEQNDGSLENAESIAVDLRKNKEGEDFILAAESSISFRVRMLAPEIASDGGDSGYAYNCPIYYSTSSVDVDNGLRYGDSVKVSRKKAAELAVVKEFGAEVPDSVKDTSFEFSLTDKRDSENEKPFSYQVYELYKRDEQGNWKNTPEAGQYATDGNGLLELQADEKAVFKKVADVSGIEVKEVENIFWKSETKDTTAEEPSYIRTVTVTNTYRPVLYVEKRLEGVPGEVDIDVLNPEFTFQVQAEKEGSLVPLAGQEYYYVKEVRTDGGIPRIDTEKGKNGKGTTGADGTFNIHKGEIIAVFPGGAGTKYEVKEVSNDSSDDDWICREDTVTGNIPVKGASVVIRNYYRWRELYLTKEITHQEEGLCDEVFTFQIQKVKKDNGTEETVLLTPEEIGKLDLTMGYLVDGEFYEVYGDEGSGDIGGLLSMSRGLNVTENGNVSLLPGFPGNSAGKINVSLNGTFSCACAGMTIRIKGLEAGQTYSITEVVKEGSMYLPEQGTVEVSMSFYGDKKEVTITNDYQMRPLSISKQVVSSDGEVDDDGIFIMQVLVNGKPLGNHPYRIQDSDVSGGIEMMSGDSQDKLTTDSEGKIMLKAGQTAILEDAGKLGDEFEVIETPAEGYIQIAPTGNGQGIFSGDGAEVIFVNTKDNNGKNLYISKIYEAYQEPSDWLWKVNGYVEELKEANRTEGTSETEKGSVEVTLTINGEIFTGGEGQEFTVVNQLTGDVSKKVWNGPTFMLDPWSVVIIPIEDEAGDISYTLSESKEDQHRIVEYKDADGVWMIEGSWLEISQKDPKSDRPVEGTVEENPVATITNEVKAADTCSLVTKQMTADSSPIPEGAELVWRVEVFNGVTWQPAEGVPYITLAGDWTKDASGAGVIPTCDRVLKTGPDGRIVLTKEQWEDGIDRQPAVYFSVVSVFVNKYGNARKGDYRVVEAMEESDEAWGILKEYASDWYFPMNDKGLNLFNAGGFINSNETAPIEIAKEMEGDSDETFTMILKQVLSLGLNTDFNNIGEGWEKNIVASEGRAGIPYTVYNTATGEMVEEKETGKNGEIYLKAGQHARLNLSNTLWTVSEDIGYTYKLKSLTPENETKLKRLNDNLMLINGDFSFPPAYTVVYLDGTDENVVFEPQIYSGLKEGDETPGFKGELTREGYEFIGWAPTVNPVVSADDVSEESEDGEIIYKAVWYKKKEYTVRYTDGVVGETIFADQNYEDREEGTATPEFEGGEPTRDGYIFVGWDPEWKETLSGDNLEIVYTAMWAKNMCTVTYFVNEEIIGTVRRNGNTNHTITAPRSGDQYPENMEFLGWATSPDGEVVYQPGNEITLYDDINLYAVLKKK